MANHIKQKAYSLNYEASIEDGRLIYVGNYNNENINVDRPISDYKLDPNIIVKINVFSWLKFLIVGLIFFLIYAGYIIDYYDLSILLFLTGWYLIVLFFGLFKSRIKIYSLSSDTDRIYFLKNIKSDDFIKQFIA